jgi:hypothetical protein
MIRLLIEFLLPLLAPTFVYSLWLAWEKRRVEALGPDAAAAAPTMREAPWVWLGAIGIGFVLVVAITMSMTRSLGDVGGGAYVAPRNVDGRVVPGHLEPEKR